MDVVKRITAGQARQMSPRAALEALRAAGVILPPMKPMAFYVRKALARWHG